MQVVFVDKFLGYVGYFDVYIFRAVKGGMEIEVIDVKSENFAPLWERTLLRRSFRISKDAVLVPTPPGYLMFWHAMVMQVLLRSDFSGQNAQTTFEKAIPFCHSRGVSS